MTRRQPARESAAAASALRLPTKAIWSCGPADSSGATPEISRSPRLPTRFQVIGNFRDPHHPVSYKLMPVDPSAQVAATARVHPNAQIGPQVVIGEFAIVEEDVVIGAFCRLEPYVYVKRWTTLGERNEISAGTVLGTDPLDKNFTGERSYLRIGRSATSSANTTRSRAGRSRRARPRSATATTS